MKNIILPESDGNSIYLSDINPETRGIIIVYSEGKVVGYIARDSECYWNFSKDLTLDSLDCAEYLNELIPMITKEYKDVTLKLLEFNN